MKRMTLFIWIFAISFDLNAANIIDVYGVDSKEAQEIINKYGAQVGDIESKLFKEMLKFSNGTKDDYMEKIIFPKRTQLIKKIQKQYNFAFVQFDTIFYPNDKDTHTTIEVITQNEKSRLRFIQPKTKIHTTPKPKHDLVEKMVTFHDTSMNLMMNNQLTVKDTNCSAYHCLPGSNHPKLKSSFNELSHGARKEKALLIKTINSDSSSERRIAAVFLVGNLNDPQEIISLLNKYVMDSDEGVRNAVMRVIAETMRKAKIDEINVKPFLELLDSPHFTDRNKALYVLFNASNSTTAKKIIIRDGSKRLIALLKLKQPNNHTPAYGLLKSITGKDFGSENIDAWEKWLAKMNKQHV